jgi:phosphoenolpyruvate phosphomutase
VILVSAGDSLGAKLIQEAGFGGCWVSGFEATARLGLPDNGSITLTEMLNITKPIVDATDLPVYVDVDTGYGNFARTVREFENIGVAGICIEDVEPAYKQNSLWGDKVPLMDMERFAEKIFIPHTLNIIARTEAFVRGYGEEETFKRLETYRDAGADMLFPHSRTKPLQVPKDLDCYVIAPTKFPEYTNNQLYDMGYSMIIWANQTCRVQIKAVREMLACLKKHDRMLEAEQGLCATLDDMKGLAE